MDLFDATESVSIHMAGRHTGRLDIGSTRPIEEAHRPLCKIPYQYSDHRDYLPQFTARVNGVVFIGARLEACACVHMSKSSCLNLLRSFQPGRLALVIVHLLVWLTSVFTFDHTAAVGPCVSHDVTGQATLVWFDKLCRPEKFPLEAEQASAVATEAHVGRPLKTRQPLQLRDVLARPDLQQLIIRLPEVLHSFLLGTNTNFATVPWERLLFITVVTFPFVHVPTAGGGHVQCYAGLCHGYMRHDSFAYDIERGLVAYGRLLLLLAFADPLDGHQHQLAVFQKYERANAHNERHPTLGGVWVRRTPQLAVLGVRRVCSLMSVEDCQQNHEYSLKLYERRSTPLSRRS
eukprot:TRINITY_DN2514_c0_g2_i19.p1 TRINITY_DN2514_c0_g2~~TRINITY_DN2514_c0_g2_i19.p1  ORF type:complete len:347 (-),score=18.87 TRINITY_DN2514_c0_g2_i19:474-1514(-)